MADLHRTLSSLNSIEAPDLWPEIERRAASPAPSQQEGVGRFQFMFSATKFIVAGVIVALFGGFLLAGVLTQPEETSPIVGASTSPESTTSRPIELPTEIPAGIESGTLDTPLGPARWAHLRGDDTTLPPGGRFQLAKASDGYIELEWDSTPMKLWRSPDLITWTSEPLSIRAGSGELWHVDGTYWLSTFEPSGLWRSQDAVSWEPLDLERLARPGPDEYAWELRLRRPLAHDGVVLVPFEWAADYGLLTRGLPGADQMRSPEVFEIEPGVFAFHEFNDPDVRARVRFEETASGVRVGDHEDDAELMLHKGVSMEFIERLTTGDGIPGVLGLGVLEGDRLEGAELPAHVDASHHQALTVDDAGFVSYSLEPDGMVQVHRSEDGRRWIETDVIGDDASEPTDIEAVWTSLGSVPGRGSVRMESTSGPEWMTTDGVLWETPPPGFHGARFAAGWITGPMHMGGLEGAEIRMWYQPNGGEPVAIDAEWDLTTDNCGGWEGLISSNTIAGSFDGECLGRREIWVITFDDVPA